MSLAYQKKKRGNIILRTHPLHRIFISILIAAIVLLVAPHHKIALVNALIAWLVFGFTYLLLNWIVLFNRPIREIRRFAQQDDGSKSFVFVMIMLFSFSSLIIVLILITTEAINQNDHTLFSKLFPLIC